MLKRLILGDFMKITSIKHMTFLLSFTACFSQASEPLNQKTWFSQAMDSIGQSSFMHSFSNCIKKLETSHSNDPASPEYQALGSEAQCTLCTPQKHHLPIKKFDLPLALVASDAIYVNEADLNAREYGSRRATMHHEAVHAKYHDAAGLKLFSLAGLGFGIISAHTLLKALNITKYRKTLIATAGLSLMTYSLLKYKVFMERRADIQGMYATQCSSCIRKEIQERKNHIMKNCPDLPAAEAKRFVDFLEYLSNLQGYLTPAELEQIAQDLGDKKCAYHSK